MGSPFVGRATGGGGGILDRAEARRALELIADPQGRVELRPLPSARSVVLPGNDIDGLVEAAAEAEQFGNTVYMVLNPVTATTSRSCKDGDIAARRWLFLDIDPLRAKGHEKECATDAEKAEAGAAVARIADWLVDCGFPPGIQVDSGNGYYLLSRIELPNDEHSKQLLKRFTLKLRERFASDTVTVDRSVFNASRLAKVPGTLARKGESTPQRPHRPCRLLYVPEVLEPISVELLQSIAGSASAQAHPGPASPFVNRAGSGDKAAYGRKALQAEVGRIILAIPGPQEGRNNALFKAAANLAELVAGGCLSRSEVESALAHAAHHAGLPDSEIGPTIASGFTHGEQNPRTPGPKPSLNGTHQPSSTPGESAEEGAEAEEDQVTYLASTVKPRKVEWLWPRRIPMGKLVTIAGIMGEGKTFLLCDLTARLSIGGPWPDSPDVKFDPAETLFISGEDDPDDTLVPRLIECGADLTQVRFLAMGALMNFSLGSLKILDRAADEAKGKLRLIVIDPPTCYLAGVDDHKNAELRRLLTPLKHWSAERRCAVIFITHLNKGGGQKIEAIFRVIGGIAWMAAVRAGHLVATDPDDIDKRIFVPLKSNLGKRMPALAFTLEETGEDLARVKWLGEVDVSANQAVNRERGKPRRIVAKDWLVERFKEKREWASDDLFKAAKAANISRDSIFEAKGILDLPKARRVAAENGDVHWIWWVPEDWEPPQEKKAPKAPPPVDDERGYE